MSACERPSFCLSAGSMAPAVPPGGHRQISANFCNVAPPHLLAQFSQIVQAQNVERFWTPADADWIEEAMIDSDADRLPEKYLYM